MIYFITDETEAFVKIGKAEDPFKRLEALQTANPRELKIVGVVEGGLPKECKLHKRFAPWLIRGEWYRFVREIRDYIAENAVVLEPDDSLDKALAAVPMTMVLPEWLMRKRKTRRCDRCGKVKPLKYFYKAHGEPGGRETGCKDCMGDKPSMRKT